MQEYIISIKHTSQYHWKPWWLNPPIWLSLIFSGCWRLISFQFSTKHVFWPNFHPNLVDESPDFQISLCSSFDLRESPMPHWCPIFGSTHGEGFQRPQRLPLWQMFVQHLRRPLQIHQGFDWFHWGLNSVKHHFMGNFWDPISNWSHTLKTTGLTAKNAISPLYIWFETLWRSRKPVPAADFTSNLEIDFNQYIIERTLPSAISEVKRVTWLHRIRWHWKIGSSHKWITVQRFLRQINPSRSWTSITSQNDDAGKRLHAWAIRHAFFGCKRTGECAGLDSRQRHPPKKCNCRFILNSVAHSVTLHSNSFHPTPSLTHSTSLNIPLLCVPLCILLHLTFCHCFLSFFHLPLGFRLSSLATYISQSCQKPVGPSNQNKACDLQFLLVKTKGLWVCGTQILGHTNIFSIKKHHQCGQEILLTP